MYARRQAGRWRLVAVAMVLLGVLAAVLLTVPAREGAPAASSVQASEPPPAATVEAAPAPDPDSPFPRGTHVRTTEGVNLRVGPNLQSPVLATMAPGSDLVVIEGPRESDGYRWWRVETTTGTVQQGWMAEGWWERATPQAAAPAGSR